MQNSGSRTKNSEVEFDVCVTVDKVRFPKNIVFWWKRDPIFNFLYRRSLWTIFE